MGHLIPPGHINCKLVVVKGRAPSHPHYHRKEKTKHRENHLHFFSLITFNSETIVIIINIRARSTLQNQLAGNISSSLSGLQSQNVRLSKNKKLETTKVS